jgi:hypothetical protein
MLARDLRIQEVAQRSAACSPRLPRVAGAGPPLAWAVPLLVHPAPDANDIFHAPSIGPIGLLLLAGAVVLLARSRRAAVTTPRHPAVP